MSIALNIACIVLFTINAVLNAVQKKWALTAIWSLGALCWVGSAILSYESAMMMGH